MAEIMGLGLSHYPPLGWKDGSMTDLLRITMKDPAIPAEALNTANWPELARAEWSNDEGLAAAGAHRKALVEQFRRVRAELDAFKPDVVLIWGDDQYENFKEDIIPPFCICAYDDIDVYPWRDISSMARPNVWDEKGEDLHYKLRGRRDIAKHLTTELLKRNFDVAYAYKPLHHASLAHAFINAIMYLDYDRDKGWDYPTIAMPVNCYGRKVVCAKGSLSRFDATLDLDPPSPSPARCMDVGANVARILKESPWRVALIASSSWSHAFLTDHTWRMRPDTVADRKLYNALAARDYATWRAQTVEDFENAGQHEVLNWSMLMGAMEALGADLKWSNFVETAVLNSNKVFAAYRPV